MKAVLMAGGFGKRLHPLTSNIPKPLVPVCGKPIMAYVIDLLRKFDINDIVVLLYHQPHLIKDYFKDGKEFGVNLTYVTADQDFGTAGAVKYAAEYLDEPFIVISADIISTFNLQEIISFHKKKKSAATITLTRVSNPLEYGIVISESDGRIKHFLEKPTWSEVFSDTINTGIYLLEPKVLDLIPENRSFDFSMDLFPKMLKNRDPLFGCVVDGYWKDIGNLVEYRNAHKDALSGKISFCRHGVSRTAKISSSAVITGNVSIGDNTYVLEGAVITDSVLGSNCIVGRDCVISDSVLWDDVEIGKSSRVTDCVIANNSIIHERVVLEEGSIVSESVVVESDTTVKPYIRIWPNKIIEEGSTVNSSVIWRQRWTNTIFGAYGVTGIGNVEITPEFAAKLGSAFGAMLGKGNTVTSSMDGHKSSRMISRALISGLLSSGVNVSNLETVPLPINRYELKALRSKGGIHVRKSPFDPNLIDIKFLDSDGMDLSPSKEKSIERMFWGEDFERVTIDEIGELTYPFYRVAEGYKEGLFNFVDAERIRNKNLKVVIDYSYGSASAIFPSILGKLGVDAVSINGNFDETRLTKSREEFERLLKQLSQIVLSLRADLGVMFDAGAEKIFLVDDRGRILSGEKALALYSLLVVNSGGVGSIAVPVTESSVIDEIAAKKNVDLIRTKTNLRSMMEAAADSKVQFFGEGLGGYIFAGFQPAFDAMLSTAKLFDLIAEVDVLVSDLVDSLPERHLMKENLPCPNSLKGAVIRLIVDEIKDGKAELVDGVKVIFGSDWVLINGHPDKQEINIYAESDNLSSATNLVSRFKEKISRIISNRLGR